MPPDQQARPPLRELGGQALAHAAQAREVRQAGRTDSAMGPKADGAGGALGKRIRQACAMKTQW